MSADNWAVCPKCLSEAQAKSLAAVEEAAAAYGKVPRDEWLKLQVEAEATPDREKFRTFREDYEFYGAEEGTIVADYGGSCEVCGLQVTLHTEKPFWTRGA